MTEAMYEFPPLIDVLAKMAKRDNAQLVNQSSGKVEYYTPVAIIEAARRTMGSIELDPASCVAANWTVFADQFFTLGDDGLSKSWHANTLFLNHPFSRQHNAKWINKLIHEYKSERTKQACCITFASTSEAWFRPLFAYPQCYLSPRTNYIGADGKPVKGVTKGSVVTYLGPNVDSFAEEFKTLGNVMVSWSKA